MWPKGIATLKIIKKKRDKETVESHDYDKHYIFKIFINVFA